MSAREEILSAAFTLFLAHGYDGTGLSEILTTAGLSKGAFYHHFASKEVLFEEVIARFFPSPFDGFDWDAHSLRDAAAQQQAIRLHYEEIVSYSLAVGGDMRRYFALFFDSLARLPAFRSGIEAAYRRAIDELAAALTRDKGLNPAAAERTARAFIAAQEGELYLLGVIRPAQPAEEDG